MGCTKLCKILLSLVRYVGGTGLAVTKPAPICSAHLAGRRCSNKSMQSARHRMVVSTHTVERSPLGSPRTPLTSPRGVDYPDRPAHVQPARMLRTRPSPRAAASSSVLPPVGDTRAAAPFNGEYMPPAFISRLAMQHSSAVNEVRRCDEYNRRSAAWEVRAASRSSWFLRRLVVPHLPAAADS